MGYHVNILRLSGQVEELFTRAEIDALVKSDPSLSAIEDEKGYVTIERDLSVAGAENAYLFFHKGMLWAKNPQRSSLQLMLDIADKLGARVRGDENETYITPDETMMHPDDAPLFQEEAARRKRENLHSRKVKLLVMLGAIILFSLLGFFMPT